MSVQPMSPARWVGAIVMLIVVALLLWRETEKREPVSPTSEMEPASVNDLEIPGLNAADLPRLESLSVLVDDQPLPSRELDLQSWRTTQGGLVYFMPAPELPMFDLRLVFAAGASRDGDQPGIASLTNSLLGEGSGELDAGAIATGFEELGAQFDNSAHRDMATANLRSLSAMEQRQAALDLFIQVVAAPSFPEDAFERLREQYLAGLQLRQQRPAALASEAFWSALYPDHPYGHLPQGSVDSLAALTPQALHDFHKQFYNASNLTIALVGDLDRNEAEQIAQQLADALPQGRVADELPALPEVAGDHRHVDFDSQQTHILIGQHGVTRHDPDYPALYVANQILGGSGFGSRLMEQIREQRGLSYSVSSGFTPMAARGPFMISMQTRSDQAREALDVINQTLDQFIAEGPSDDELARAKRQLLGQFVLGTSSNSAIVSQLAANGFYDLPANQMQQFIKEIEALSAEDIRTALQQHLPAEQRLTITLGPPLDEDDA
ncbi:M16 family metallopeptidase [Halopseudomonas salegens]|uniref:Zinc protease n=1 Tax=Halopseudomonas salegens TaxID=1434072 RepID=A0A1H2I1U4_9GAMM|nr:pitrilysin family protein [Halopseudomonas salegens]SDU37935.1 zinc protease [Halopseudomonas salegens]